MKLKQTLKKNKSSCNNMFMTFFNFMMTIFCKNQGSDTDLSYKLCVSGYATLRKTVLKNSKKG